MRLNVPFKMLPPYQRIVQADERYSNLLHLATSEAVASRASELFYHRCTKSPQTWRVVYTNEQKPEYIYTSVVHPKTGEPLFFRHVLPKFSYQTDSELRVQITITDQYDNPVPEELYFVSAENYLGTYNQYFKVDDYITIHTNLFSDDDTIYFVHIRPYPYWQSGFQKKLLLDSRINQTSFIKPAEYQWQLDVGYQSEYVPGELTLDSEWPLIDRSQFNAYQYGSAKVYIGTCVQTAIKLHENIYKVQKLLYLDVFSDQEVLSISSHGYQYINSVEPVVKLYCRYIAFGEPKQLDVRQASYEAYTVPLKGGDYLDLL